MRKVLVVAVLLMIPAILNAGRLVRIPTETDGAFEAVQDMGYEITSGSRAAGYVDILVSQGYVEETLLRYPQAKLLPLAW